MKRKHQKILEQVFAQPISGNLRWRDVESLLRALDAAVSERAGSRVAVELRDRVAVFHRPHPRPTLDKGAVRHLRRFLESAGVKP